MSRQKTDLLSALEEGRGDLSPLASRCRPQTFADFEGQEKWLSPGSPVLKWIENQKLPSLVIWGPPGSGKTSLARLLAQKLDKYQFEEISATSANVADIKKIIHAAEATRYQKPTLLFVDEIHRFSKLQQDALLAAVESGTLTLVGVTTENPKYSVNPALLSRAQVIEFKPLSDTALLKIMQKGLARWKGEWPQGKSYSQEAVDNNLLFLAKSSGGDARRALNLLEGLLNTDPLLLLDTESLRMHLQKLDAEKPFHSLSEQDHYAMISAYIKAMRRGDQDEAFKSLARLLVRGEDPMFIARRLVIFAAEDVGLASPHFLSYASSVLQSVEKIGMPEARILLAAGTLAACRARKSREAYDLIGEAWGIAESEKA